MNRHSMRHSMRATTDWSSHLVERNGGWYFEGEDMRTIVGPYKTAYSAQKAAEDHYRVLRTLETQNLRRITL